MTDQAPVVSDFDVEAMPRAMDYPTLEDAYFVLHEWAHEAVAEVRRLEDAWLVEHNKYLAELDRAEKAEDEVRKLHEELGVERAVRRTFLSDDEMANLRGGWREGQS